MKISFFELSENEKDIIAPFFEGMEVSFTEEKLNDSSAALYSDVEIVSVFINSKVDQAVIDAMPNLKLITTRSTGFDHIDVSYAKSKGIQIATVSAYGSHTVAEFAFGLILNLSRKIIMANDYVRGSAEFRYFPTMEGFNLFGKTLGVIGTGKIGKNMVKIAKGFGMNIVAYDLYPDQAFASENGMTYKTLQEVLKESDIVSLHTPYTKENHHLINRENISLFKKGAYLINTARGELVDTDALIYAIKEGFLSGAGIDVIEGEKDLKEEIEILASTDRSSKVEDYKTLLEDRVLLEMPNVIITPHVAFYTKEAEDEIRNTSIENIKSFIAGNPVNLIK